MSDETPVKLTDNALTVLKRRYLARNDNGETVESPSQMFRRVAGHIAGADRNYGVDAAAIEQTTREFYQIMASLNFLPNSPTLMNAGRPLGQLSACFVLPIGDSIEEIFEANKNAALIHKSGGGTGFSFSQLRPGGSMVASTKGVASGPVSFMKVIDSSTEAIKQGGTRRGANMGILRIDHPDIVDFITCKDDLSQITNFNISVAATDEFMQAVKDDSTIDLRDPRSGKAYIIEGRTASVKARQLFDLIVDRAWRTGEPGLVFIDRMNQQNPTYPEETIEATNPCGEQPLPPYDSCNLGSINLAKFVCDPLPSDFSSDNSDNIEKGVDWERLGQTIRTAIHFLDNVIDLNRYPLEQIAKQSRKNRRVGLGVMGWADMLVKLSLSYDDDRALELADRVMSFVQSEGHKHSSELAKSRGKFPNWTHSKYSAENIVMRNATVTTVAPTGTLSIIAGCSSGIEPYFSLAFERRVLDGTRLVETNSLFEVAARQAGILDDKLIAKVSSVRSIADMDEIPEHIRDIFKTAADISPEGHIRMQAAFQKHCDSSVSKTINLSQDADRDDVRESFLKAYELGCKGITVYRDNARPDQVLSTNKTDAPTTVKTGKVQSRPASLEGFTEKIRTGYGNLYVTVNLHQGRPFEVFAQIGKSGYTTMADTEAICRLISLALRSGIGVEKIISQLRGIGGASQVFTDGGKVTSIPDAIARILEKRFGAEMSNLTESSSAAEICPECSSPMILDSGCFYCHSCGYSNC